MSEELNEELTGTEPQPEVEVTGSEEVEAPAEAPAESAESADETPSSDEE